MLVVTQAGAGFEKRSSLDGDLVDAHRALPRLTGFRCVLGDGGYTQVSVLHCEIRLSVRRPCHCVSDGAARFLTQKYGQFLAIFEVVYPVVWKKSLDSVWEISLKTGMTTYQI